MLNFLASVTALAAVCLTISTAADVSTGPVWGYKENDSSMVAASKWSEHWEACGGTRQSPIDIETTSAVQSKNTGKTKSSLAFSGKCSQFNMTEPHEPLEVDAIGGSCTASANGTAYKLAQFHLHAPSEHTLDGEALDGEIHFVHKSSDGSALLVVGVFLKVAQKTDGWLLPVLDGLDHVNSVEQHEPIVVTLKSYSTLIKKAINGGSLYNYPGSLTTPGCGENADWWVVQTPIKISAIDFGRLHQDLVEYNITNDGDNARPVQPLNGRTVTRFDY